MSLEYHHYTVMQKEAVDVFPWDDGKIYVDATLGGAGHSSLIARNMGQNSRLYSFDVDEDAIIVSSERLKEFSNVKVIKDSYTNFDYHLSKDGIDEITGGIIFDFGASTHQLTTQERGFSFLKEARLDMRFDKERDFSAIDVVNSYKESELVDIFSKYGEEHFSKRIAKKIVLERAVKKIETTTQLAKIVKDSVPNIKTRIHPATRVFQAIRIEVNDELKNIKSVLEKIIPMMGKGAIISVITFHSLEDRIVKEIFKYHSRKCHCGIYDTVCKCPPPSLELVNKKPFYPTDAEIKENVASRSAKLRVAKKIN